MTTKEEFASSIESNLQKLKDGETIAMALVARHTTGSQTVCLFGDHVLLLGLLTAVFEKLRPAVAETLIPTSLSRRIEPE